jgi:pyruvate dehydrogenase E2 component (dihydrolipoamide acetyltransferase)
MAAEFIMPKLGLTMESGIIESWLVPDGTLVSAGEAVASVETDKVVTEIESSASGVLRYVGTAGTSYECGQLIGWICAPGEAPPATVAATTLGADPASLRTSTAAANGFASNSSNSSSAVTVSDGSRLFASPNAKRIAASLGVPLSVVRGTGPDGRIVSEDVERAHASGITTPPQLWPSVAVSQYAQNAPWGTMQGATFAAIQLARMVGLDATRVPTVSLDGIVTRDDVAEYIRTLIHRVRPESDHLATSQSGAQSHSQEAAPPTVPPTASLLSAAPITGSPSVVLGVGLTPMRRVIAQRMSESIHSMAQLTLTIDVDMDVVVADRQRRKNPKGQKGQKGRKPSNAVAPGFTDYVIMASAIALQRNPYVNSSMTNSGIVLHPVIDVGMAVAVDGGLMVPVIRSPHDLTLDTLSVETTRLAAAARDGRLSLQEMEGGTFSVTALGMFGVDTFTPIINPPNSAILGVGRIRTDTAWIDGVPAPVSRMALSLTWDHRVFDGAPAAEFAREVKSVLEDPERWATA